MSELFKISTIWVVNFRQQGRPRRWFKSFGPAGNMHAKMTNLLNVLFGKRAGLIEMRREPMVDLALPRFLD